MPILKDSDDDEYEIALVKGKRGRKWAHVPVKDSETASSPSRSVSPSKKRPLSPQKVQPNDNEQSLPGPKPKRSRRSGKVTFQMFAVNRAETMSSEPKRLPQRVSWAKS